MSVEALHVAGEFYAIEALHAVVSMNYKYGMKSHERLLEDIITYKTVLVENLSNMLFDYSALAVFGEMRHAMQRCNYYYDEVYGGSRESAYKMAIKYNPINILEASSKLFDKCWSSSYGGKKWKLIADTVLLRNKLPANIFCDTCLSLSHNTSCYLNKSQSNIFKIDHSGMYRELMDFKYECKDFNELIFYVYNLCSKVTKKLIERAVVLGFIKHKESKNFFSYSNNNIVETLNYEPIEWGHELLSMKMLKTDGHDKDGEEDEEDDKDDKDKCVLGTIEQPKEETWYSVSTTSVFLEQNYGERV